MKKRIFLLMTLSLFLSGCGFHLRGSTAIPKQFHTLYITGSRPNSTFVKTLSQGLADRGVKLVGAPEQAPYTLNIIHSKLTTVQTSISSSQQIRQFEVTFSATYRIQSPNGNTIVGPLTTNEVLTQTMQANELLANTNQLRSTEEQLQQEVITLMIFRLASTDTLLKLDHYAKKKAH